MRFPTFNFSDTGLTPIGRDKAGVTKSQTIQFTDNISWARGKHTLKFRVDVRRVAYADIESFGGSDDFEHPRFRAEGSRVIRPVLPV